MNIFSENIVFGCGGRFQLWSKIPEKFRSDVVLLVSERLKNSGKLSDFLPIDSLEIIAVPSMEPTISMVEKVREKIGSREISALIAIGGGSVIDCGKMAAIYLEQSNKIHSMREYFEGKYQLQPRERIFFAALPTTAGTGAEVTNNAVIIDDVTAVKKSLRDDSMIADLALIDPELTYDCPQKIVAASGLDSLTQAIECAISRKTTCETRRMASEAFLKVLANLESAYSGDKEAKNIMAYATTLGGVAFRIGGLGAAHGLAHPIGSLRHIAHGEACGILLEHILRINIEAVDKLAGELGFASGNELIEKFVALRNKLGVSDNFRKYDIKQEDFAFIAKNCRSGSMSCNPVAMRDEDIYELLTKIC